MKGLSTYITSSCNCSNIILSSWASHWLQCNICWSHKHASIILYDAYFISSWYCKLVLVMKQLRDSFAEERSSKRWEVTYYTYYTLVFLTLLHMILYNFIIVIRIWRVSYTCGWPNTFLNGQILTEIFGHLSMYCFFLILNSAIYHMWLYLRKAGLQAHL